MINVLRAWIKKVHNQSLPAKEQTMTPAESAGPTELGDVELEAVSGGCAQYGHEGYGYGRSYRGHHSGEGYPYHNRHHGYGGYDGYDDCGSSSWHHCGPNTWGC
jgi:mersacidin/lichenicidin family type 2 lantibiotic